LQQKKYRDQEGLFVAEGTKCVTSFLDAGASLETLIVTEKAHLEHPNAQTISSKDFAKISSLKNPNGVLGVFKIPNPRVLPSSGLVIALDAIRDPGNLGTVIRLCDWFGVANIVCSLDTVDCYNPKVVQATMGSLATTQIHYTDLTEYLPASSLPIYGAVMEGENLYKSELPSEAIVILGNEGKGISAPVLELLTHTLTIPQFGVQQTAESLNVATATAIVLSEFRRLIGT